MADEEVVIEVKTQVDTEEVEELQSLLEEIGEMNLELTASMDASEIEDAQTMLDDMDGTTIEASVEVDSSSVDEANEKVQETNDSANDLGMTVAGLGGLFAVDTMIYKADAVQTSWNQLGLTYEGTGVKVDDLKAKTKQLQQETGKSGSQIRDYYNQMGIAGITNVDLLTESFRNLSGRAYQTGSSVNDMEGAVQKMVMSGNAGAKMLSRLGVSNTALAEAMGVTGEETAEAFKKLDETERLEVLNKAMGDGTKANEMYKNSYVGLQEQMGIAFGGLMVTIGQSILPVVIPAVQTLTQVIKGLGDIVKQIPSPIMSVVGVLLGGISVLTTLIGVVGMVGKVIGGVKDGLKTFKDTVGTAIDKVKNLGTTMSNLKTKIITTATTIKEKMITALTGLKDAIVGAVTKVKELAIAFVNQARQTMVAVYSWIAEKVQVIIDTAVKTANIVVTYALAVAEFLLASPILLVTLVIIGVIAVLWYLYNTNETVRNGINWLINAFKQVASIVIGAVINAFNKAVAIFNTVKSVMSQLSNTIKGMFANAWNNLKSSVENAIAPIKRMYDTLKNIVDLVLNNGKAVGDFIGGLGGAIGLGGADIKESVGTSAELLKNFNVTSDISKGSVGRNSTSTSNNSNSVNIDTVIINNDDDMDSFVKKLNHALNWTNTNGARSV